MDFQGNNQESVLGMAQGSARSGAQVVTKAIAVCDTVFDDCDERPVDSDFVLPDYCPDIAAVLKCTLEPVIQNKQLSGDRVSADGVAFLRPDGGDSFSGSVRLRQRCADEHPRRTSG